MTYQDWKTFPWTKSAGHNCLYALIKHTVWWWHPRSSFTHFLLRSFRRREAGTDSLTRTRQLESCAGNLVVWLQNVWDPRVLIGTGRRKEPRVAFMLLPCTFEVHLYLGYEEVSIKYLSSPQHFTTHLGHGWGEIKIPTDHFRPSVCVSSSVLLVSATYSVTRQQIPCGKRLCTTLAPNPTPHTPNRRVPRESPSDWFHEWRQVLCKLVHGALFSSWEPWKTSDAHTLRTRLSLEIYCGDGRKQSANETTNESLSAEAWLWRQRELLLMLPIQVHMLPGSQ